MKILSREIILSEAISRIITTKLENEKFGIFIEGIAFSFDKKNLVESKIGTLYLLQENQILTPSLVSGCQDLVLRNVFNRWLRKSNSSYSLVETELNPFELQKAEEVIIVSLARGFQGVSNYRKTIYSQKRAELIFNNFSDNLIN